MKRGLLGAGVAIVVFGMAGCGGSTPATSDQSSASPSVDIGTVLDQAVAACKVKYSVHGAEIADGGTTLILDGSGEDDPAGMPYADQKCLLDELHMPTYVDEQMRNTRALDGRQSADWDGIQASWSYHPDDGLDVVLHLDEAASSS